MASSFRVWRLSCRRGMVAGSVQTSSKNQSHLPRRVTTKVSSLSAETWSFEASPEERTSS